MSDEKKKPGRPPKTPINSAEHRLTQAGRAAPATNQENLDVIPETKPSKPSEQNKRWYTTGVELDHDLYKLEPAAMLRDVSYNSDAVYTRFEHCHVYHTITSDGKRLDTSAATGGHFHVMSLEPAKDENSPPVVTCGPPVRYAWQKKGKRQIKVTVPYCRGDDTHTHDVIYIRSEKIKPRRLNSEFLKYKGTQDARHQGVKGIQG